MIADLRNAVFDRLVAAEVLPASAIYNCHEAAIPPDRVASINVAGPKFSGMIGPSAGYACDIDVTIALEIQVNGTDDKTIADALDGLVWLCLRALLIDPDFREAWPLKPFSAGHDHLEGKRLTQGRILALGFSLPIDFTTVPADMLEAVNAAYDVASPGDDAHPEEHDFQDTILEAPP